MIDKLNQLVGNIKSVTDDLSSEIEYIKDFPSIINIVYNAADDLNRIVVTLDNSLPDDYELIVRDINTGNIQDASYSWDENVCTITTVDIVLTPFLVVIVKLPDYFIITGSTSVTPKWTTAGSALEYKLGDGNWEDATSGSSISTGDVVKFRGEDRTGLFTTSISGNAWVINGSDVTISGNLNALLDYNNPPSTIDANCFSYMFWNCTSIKTFNATLPATTLGSDSYSTMFYGCTSLINAPTLPATTLTVACYTQMFQGCTSLVNVPELPSTTLSEYCYYSMFKGCTSLVNAPELPADTLVDNCYTSMFQGCGHLVSAPNSDVYTTYLPPQANMFTSCTELTSPLLHCDIPFSFGGGICLLTITNATSVTPKWTVTGSPLEYKLGDADWQDATSGTAITVTDGDDIKFRGSGRTGLFTSNKSSNAWSIIGSDVIISGNMQTLLNYTSPTTSIGNYGFNNMFRDCTSIKTFNATLPATTLGDDSYSNIFYGCTGLIKPPVLPAMTLVEACYASMFRGCISLVTAPNLPATTLAHSCYNGMFWDCSNLVDAPVLSVMTLFGECYRRMFTNCTSLVNAPALPATTLIDYCYFTMFDGCTSLESAPNCDVYITYTPQTGMFHDCIALVSPVAYADIPDSWK
jgi:hypothetical protein